MAVIQEQLTPDELASIYRVESKNTALSSVRKDLYPAMARLLKELNAECYRLLSKDASSIFYEGAHQKKQAVQKYIRDVVSLRMKKIINMSYLCVMGKDNSLDNMTKEEQEYYNKMVVLSKDMAESVDRLMDDGPKTMKLVPEAEPEPEPEPLPEPIIEREPKPPSINYVPESTVQEQPATVTTYNSYEEEYQERIFNAEEEPRDYDDDDEYDESPDEDDEALFFQPKPVMAKKPRIVEELPDDYVPIPTSTVDRSSEIVTYKLIRILEDMPAFSGIDRDYELHKEELIVLVSYLADVLIDTGKAVEIIPS